LHGGDAAYDPIPVTREKELDSRVGVEWVRGIEQIRDIAPKWRDPERVIAV
jgi:hypothetical protein